MANFPTQPLQYLTDDPGIIAPVNDTYDWNQYGQALTALETAMLRLFNEIEIAESAAQYSFSLANTGLSSIQSSYRTLKSQTDSLMTNANQLAQQILPCTGGQYTHLITESFTNGSVQDLASGFSKEPLILAEPWLPSGSYASGSYGSEVSGSIGCPTRADLRIDPVSQSLKLPKAGTAVLFNGIPGNNTTLGGSIEVDRVYGTPVESTQPRTKEASWLLSCASNSPLTSGFSNAATPAWLPNSYQAGAATRLHVKLTNPSSVTELRIRGTALPEGGQTTLLETVAGIDSRPNPSDPGSQPTRPCNQQGNFLSTSDWTVLSGTIETGVAPWNTIAEPVNSAQLNGLVGQAITLPTGNHLLLRYLAASPYTEASSPASGWQVAGSSGTAIPNPPTTTFVQVYYYGEDSPVIGQTSPLAIETFRDEYLSQAGLYAGWSQFTHLLSIPAGTQTAYLVLGLDPLVSQGLTPAQQLSSILYTNVWVCDEAISIVQNQDLPQPIETNLSTPGYPGSVLPYGSEEAIDSLTVSLGNYAGSLIVSDVWVTLAQDSPSIDPSAAWKIESSTPYEKKEPEPYSLSVPVNTYKGRNPNDPLVLHEARYVGLGQYEQDVSRQRLNGQYVEDPSLTRRYPLKSRSGLLSSILNRRKSRTISAPKCNQKVGRYWKDSTGMERTSQHGDVGLLSAITSAWSSLYAYLLNISKSTARPTSHMANLMGKVLSTAPINTSTGTLYVYTMGITTLALIREQYGDSGIYVTKPIQNLDPTGSIAGEIREISLLPSPPIPELNQKVRFWAIPGESDTNLSPAALLQQAIPLDSQTPRVTFHPTSELLPCVQPAISDIAEQLNMPEPAFYVTPKYYSQILPNGLSVDMAAQGLRLDHIPYINKESIQQIIQSIAGYNPQNPNVYDPNALCPVVDFLSNFDSGFVAPNQATANTVNDPTAQAAPSTTYPIDLSFLDANQNPVSFSTLCSPTLSGNNVLVSGSYISASGTCLSFPGPNTTNPTFTENVAQGCWTVNITTPATIGQYQAVFCLTVPSGGPNPNSYTATVNFNVGQQQDSLETVTGYRPIAITIKTESGHLIFPDSLGKPVPGEIMYQSLEVLQSAIAVQTQDTPAATAEYTTGGASTVLQTSQQSFVTAHSPVASSQQGVSIDLYWHQSQEFDAASGGILTRYDVKLAPSDYVVDAHTGQITVLATAPFGWSVYDQIIANYFWVVGDIAPQQWFPTPSIYSLFNQNGSYDFEGTSIDTRPQTVPVVTSPTGVPINISAINQNPNFNQSGYGPGTSGPRTEPNWTLIGNSEFNNGNNNAPASTFLSNRVLTISKDDVEGVYQDGIQYYGPGMYNIEISAAGWNLGGDIFPINWIVEIYNGTYDPVNHTTAVAGGTWSGSFNTHKPIGNWAIFPTDLAYYKPTAGQNQFTVPLDSTADLHMAIMVYQNQYLSNNPFGSNDNLYGNQIDYIALGVQAVDAVLTCPPGYELTAPAVDLLSGEGLCAGDTLPSVGTYSGCGVVTAASAPIPPSGAIATAVGTYCIKVDESLGGTITVTYETPSLGDVLDATFYSNTGNFESSFKFYNASGACVDTDGTVMPTVTSAWEQYSAGPVQILDPTVAYVIWTLQTPASGAVDLYIGDLIVNAGQATLCTAVPLAEQTFTTIEVTAGQSAGSISSAPTSVSDLLSGPILQSYPVTRNVTNYSNGTPAAFNTPNFDYLSPDYYPVIEYRVDPGGILRFATDMSNLGAFKNAELNIQYEYLDINPRLVVEYLPAGQNPLSSPLVPTAQSIVPQTSTPELTNLQLLINARY